MKRKFLELLSISMLILLMPGAALTMTCCTSQKTTKEQEIDGTFQNITISANRDANISVKPSSDGKARVVSITREKVNCTAVNDGTTLVVNINDQRSWFDRVLEFHAAEVIVYVPAGAYADLTINTKAGHTNVPADFSFESITVNSTTGNIVCNASAQKSINISNTTGDVALNNVTADTLNIRITTGKIELTNVITSGKISLKVTTGNIVFNGCDGAEIKAKATTGSIKGTLLSPKIFLTNTTTGKINVPRTTSGGICDLSTTTGKIDISIK